MSDLPEISPYLEPQRPSTMDQIRTIVNNALIPAEVKETTQRLLDTFVQIKENFPRPEDFIKKALTVLYDSPEGSSQFDVRSDFSKTGAKLFIIRSIETGQYAMVVSYGDGPVAIAGDISPHSQQFLGDTSFADSARDINYQLPLIPQALRFIYEKGADFPNHAISYGNNNTQTAYSRGYLFEGQQFQVLSIGCKKFTQLPPPPPGTPFA